MRNRKDSHRFIRQNEQTVKKSQKHEANLQKNSTLYFQVGLIVCLLVTYGLFEMKFETKIPTLGERLQPEEPYSIEIPLVQPERKPIDEPVVQKKAKNPTKIVQVIDITPINSPIIDKPIDNENPPLNPDDVILVAPPVESSPVEFIKVEQVPIYPGCERKKGREAQSKCMSDKINKLILKKFNVGLADELGLNGIQKIDVQFMIDKTGKVTEVNARAPHPLLEKEAQRVVDLIPDMKPGKQRDKPVAVRFNKPIKFKVQ